LRARAAGRAISASRTSGTGSASIAGTTAWSAAAGFRAAFWSLRANVWILEIARGDFQPNVAIALAIVAVFDFVVAGMLDETVRDSISGGSVENGGVEGRSSIVGGTRWLASLEAGEERSIADFNSGVGCKGLNIHALFKSDSALPVLENIDDCWIVAIFKSVISKNSSILKRMLRIGTRDLIWALDEKFDVLISALDLHQLEH